MDKILREIKPREMAMDFKDDRLVCKCAGSLLLPGTLNKLSRGTLAKALSNHQRR